MSETGTLKELNVKAGDVVEWLDTYTTHEVISAEVIQHGEMYGGEVRALLDRCSTGIYGDREKFRIVSRATPTIDYNDGKWHGWNGGECPVHGKSMIDVVHVANGYPKNLENYDAECQNWKNIVAFRVVKEYKEPREFWIRGSNYYHCLTDAEHLAVKQGQGDYPIIHVKEVTQ